MKQIYYTFRYLLRGKGGNLIKIASLTLGLSVALVLFSQIAFDLSYDKFYTDADQIYRIERVLNMKETHFDTPSINALVAPAFNNEFDEVVSATAMRRGGSSFVYNEKAYEEQSVVADSLFFDVFDFPLLQEERKELGVSNSVFISESLSERMFGKENAMGKPIMYGKKDGYPLIVRGVFADIPANCHLKFDVVISLNMFREMWGGLPGWWEVDSFNGYVRLAPNTDPLTVENKVPAMLKKYYDVEGFEAKGVNLRYYLTPVTGLHSKNPGVERMILILTLLAFSILFVSAMNYVLMAISSLAVRARLVGVHKCNGASTADIFSMFIYETITLVLSSLVLAGLLIFGFRSQIEDLLQTSLATIFSAQNLWVIVAVVAFLIVVAGVLPAKLFASVPVTQIFRSLGNNKKIWKRILLFVQFAGAAFMFTLLIIIVKQYNMIMNKDLGYTTGTLVYARNTSGASAGKIALAKTELARLPMVESVSVADNLPINFLSGMWIKEEEEGDVVFSSRFMYVDKDYFSTMNITLRQGRNFDQNSEQTNEIIVNEQFVKQMGWKDSPIGKTLYPSGPLSTVVGVVNNIQVAALSDQTLGIKEQPLVFFANEKMGGTLMVRLHTLNVENLKKLTEVLKETLLTQDVGFTIYKDSIENQYKEARSFRNSIGVASFLMFVITLMGLLGYITDEVLRRSKEIAIRKINGASALNILRMVSQDIFITAVPAVLLGLLCSYFVGSKWMEQFAARIPLSAGLFIVGAVFVLLIIAFCIFFKTWTVANEDPVKSIKSE